MPDSRVVQVSAIQINRWRWNARRTRYRTIGAQKRRTSRKPRRIDRVKSNSCVTQHIHAKLYRRFQPFEFICRQIPWIDLRESSTYPKEVLVSWMSRGRFRQLYERCKGRPVLIRRPAQLFTLPGIFGQMMVERPLDRSLVLRIVLQDIEVP